MNRWRIRKEGPRRWVVACPFGEREWDAYEQGWCACRAFRKWSLARNYVFKKMGAK